jgi:hypothetical protein
MSRPILTLRHINELKRLKAVPRGKHEQRLALCRLMYGQDDVAERELRERAAELDQREQELRLKQLEADIKKAINDAEIDQKSRQRLHQMAMAELRRRKKQPSARPT